MRVQPRARVLIWTWAKGLLGVISGRVHNGCGDSQEPALVGTSRACSVVPSASPGSVGPQRHPPSLAAPARATARIRCPGPTAACGRPVPLPAQRSTRRRLPQPQVAQCVLCPINIPGMSLSDEEKLPGCPRLLWGQPRGPGRTEAAPLGGEDALHLCGPRRQGPPGTAGHTEAHGGVAPGWESRPQPASLSLVMTGISNAQREGSRTRTDTVQTSVPSAALRGQRGSRHRLTPGRLRPGQRLGQSPSGSSASPPPRTPPGLYRPQQGLSLCLQEGHLVDD